MKVIVYLPLFLVFVSLSVFSYEGGDYIARVGVANVDFSEESGPVLVNNTVSLGRLSLASQRAPFVTGTRMLNSHWGVEVLLPLMPLELKAGGKGGALDGLPTVTADVWPLSITVQYYPYVSERIKPYVGLGVNYTYIDHVELDKNTATVLGIDGVESLKAKSSSGVVVQLGVDFPLTEKLMLNVSTSYLDLKLDVTGSVYAGTVNSEIAAVVELKAQPNLSVIGLSYRF
jgi:outer membrane protein